MCCKVSKIEFNINIPTQKKLLTFICHVPLTSHPDARGCGLLWLSLGMKNKLDRFGKRPGTNGFTGDANFDANFRGESHVNPDLHPFWSLSKLCCVGQPLSLPYYPPPDDDVSPLSLI